VSAGDFEQDPYARELSDDEIEQGHHRAYPGGGRWDEMGAGQLAFLHSRGLQPTHRLLDIGCGLLRAGVHFIRYLEPGNYFGIDRNASLLRAGLEVELRVAAVGPAGKTVDLRGRIEAAHLLHTVDFDLSGFGPVLFDFALAHSVFTHTPEAALRRCLGRLAPRMRVGGSLFASYFPVRPGQDANRPLSHAGGAVETWPDRDPHHHRAADLLACAAGTPWQGKTIKNWHHPMGQSLLCFTRVD
jgi:SAM-dependent methyltransferase